MNLTCIVSPDLAGPTRNGGIGTHCLYLARFLARRGQQVSIVHTGPPDDTDRDRWRETFAREHGVRLFFLDELPGKPDAPVLPHSSRHFTAHHVYRWLRTQKFSTVYFQDWQGNGAICARAKHTGQDFADTRLIVTMHGPSEWIRDGMHEFPDEGRTSLLDDALERIAVTHADAVVSPSRYLLSWLQERGWKFPQDTRLAPYLFELPVPASAPRALGSDQLKEIVFFGRLETRKGLEPFLGALKRIAARDPKGPVCDVHFVGKAHEVSIGSGKAAIERAAEIVGSRFNVAVHDTWGHREALEWLAQHPQALVVTPSLADNAPFAVIECLALGQPLLASRRGGIPELIESAEHLVEPTADALSARILAIARDGLPVCAPAWSVEAARAAWGQLADEKFARPAATFPRLQLSVCVPHYNNPAALAATLDRLAAQSTPAHEVIVVDDGSDPAHEPAWMKLADRYRDRGWRFVKKAHAGPSAARNTAAALATGDALVFCDADNLPRPDMLERLELALHSSGSEIVTCAFSAHRVDEREVWRDGPEYLFCPIGNAPELVLLENFAGDTNFIIRRETFHALGGFDESNQAASEDWQFLLRAIFAGHDIAVIPEPVFRYRLAPASHARRHSMQASAAAAWRALPAAEHSRYGRLLQAARGTFATLADLGMSRSAYRGFEATQLHVRNLEGIAAELRQRAEKADEDFRALQAHGRQVEQSLLSKIREGEQAFRHVAQQLAQTQEKAEQVHAELEDRQAKIKNMQRSFSWRLTAPLRALRRKFFDPKSGPPKVRLGPLPRLLGSVDVPSVWEAAPQTGSFAGWCIFADGTPASAVRARVGTSETPGRYGQRRPDVVVAHDFSAPESIGCGFSIPYRLPVEQDHVIHLEAQAPDGRWVQFLERTLHTSNFPRAVHDYTAWVEAFGRMTPERTAALRDRLAKIPTANRPLLTVLMPVFDPPEQWLVRAIESVQEQIYDHWEFCIANDASTQPHVRSVLDRFAAADPRIRVIHRTENGHISRASNSALEIARGEFVVLLDHDDEIPPEALAEVVLELAAHPDAAIIYSDEDKIDDEGRRYNPYFKPDFLPDLLCGQNCFSHLSVFRTSLVREVGGFRAGYEGSQDWDLALRVTERIPPDRVRHIPKILYHWRAISGSTAIEVTEKGYSLDAARQAVLDQFTRRGIAVDVQPVPGSHWRVIHPSPDPRPLVTIVIPTRNAAKLLRLCTDSIFAHTAYEPYEVLLINNRSDEKDAVALLSELGQRANVRVLDYDAPFNFSAIVNFGVREARGELVCLLNNDIEAIDDTWLTEMVSHAVRPEIGAVGAMLYYPDRTIQHAGIVLGLGSVANHAFAHHAYGTDGHMNRARLVQNYSAVTGACLVIRRKTFEQVGGFNETDLAIAFNDVDFCLRVQSAGYRNLWTPFAELIHHESASRGHEDTPEKQIRFERETAYMRRVWGGRLDHDPAYNINLALSMEGWDLAWPPRQ